MRYFIGIALPDEISKELTTLQDNMSTLYTGNPVAQENLHVTLLFLGNVLKEELTEIRSTLRSVAHPKFTLQLKNIETTSHVIWVTVPSTNLYTRIVSHLPQHEQKRDYTGHITLARVKEFSDKTAIKSLELPPISWTVTSFTLYGSQTFHEGPEYTIIEEFKLTA